MQFTWLDFFIGFFLMNAMPHLVCGLFQIRFPSAFGPSWQGNLVYATLNMIMAFGLFHWQYGVDLIPDNGIVVGAGLILFLYIISGRYIYKLYQPQTQMI